MMPLQLMATVLGNLSEATAVLFKALRQALCDRAHELIYSAPAR